MNKLDIKLTNRIAGVIVILLSLAVSVPLTIMVCVKGGGPWGFDILGLQILIPLSCYILFGIVGLIQVEARQRKAFAAAHLITFGIGVIVLLIFPARPALLVPVPVLLA